MVMQQVMFSLGDVFFWLTSEEYQFLAHFYEWSALALGTESPSEIDIFMN